MKTRLLLGVCLIVLFSAGNSSADPSGGRPEKTTISLGEIWGYNLPGTRDIAGIPLPESRDLTNLRRQREVSIEEMRRALMTKPSSERALPGFVLPRQPDYLTLKAASTQLVGDTRIGATTPPAKDVFPSGDELSLVFFSHPSSYYVRLDEVQRRGNEIKVVYRFEPHSTAQVTTHFALIPLGQLPAGEYRVQFEQTPMERKYLDAGFEPVYPEAFDIICRDFSFTVSAPPIAVDEATPKGAKLIPLDQIWAFDMPGTRDVRELEPKRDIRDLSDREFILGSRINQILVLLSRVPKESEKAGPGFVVVGKGKEALRKAHSIVLYVSENKTRPERLLPQDTELSLVFYCHTTGWPVHIKSVKQLPSLITVKYQFIAQPPLRSGTGRFALIPLGKLPTGTVEVRFEQVAPVDEKGEPSKPMRDPGRIVSDSFSFDVR